MLHAVLYATHREISCYPDFSKHKAIDTTLSDEITFLTVSFVRYIK